MLSIIIPVYNEQASIREVLEHIRVEFKDTPHEIIIIDDGSRDNTKYYSMRESGIQYIRLPRNYGKGYAVRVGFDHARGTHVAIQDGDLEYSPKTLHELYKNIKAGDEESVIYGKRDRKKGYILNRLGNAILSKTCNIIYKSNLSDIYTCYKVIPKKILDEIELSAHGFEIEAEITAKLLNKKVTIKEIDIPYSPRSFKEGKKIRAHDALAGIWTLIKYRP